MRKPKDGIYKLKRGRKLILSAYINAGHTTDKSDFKKHVEFILKGKNPQIEHFSAMETKTVRRIAAKISRIADWMETK